MIVTIIIVSLSFIWLLRESDYLMVNLYYILCESGACCSWRIQNTQVTKDMKQELFDKARGKTGNASGYFKAYHPPLCGWGFALSGTGFGLTFNSTPILLLLSISFFLLSLFLLS